jgi:ketosteroid isomerase-like protein
MHAHRIGTAALSLVALLAATAGAQGTNPPKVTKAAAARTAASPDSVVVAQERSLFDALQKNDINAFNKALGADFVYVDPTGVNMWQLANSAEMLKGCTTGQITIDSVRTRPVGNDLMIVTYKATGDQTCNGQKAPSPVYSMSVWQKRGGRWVAVAHSETPPAMK